MRIVTNEYSLFDEKGVLFVQCGFFGRIVGTGESDIFIVQVEKLIHLMSIINSSVVST